MQTPSCKSTGRLFDDGPTPEPSLGPANGVAPPSSVATRAKRTAGPDSETAQASRRLAVSSSALLTNFARELWSERTRQRRESTLPGLGIGFDPSLNDLVTLCCPSDCEPVALGLTVNAKDCSCLLKGPTPCARDWKDNGDVEKVKRHYERNQREKRGSQFPRWVAFHHGFVPGPIVYEVALGFPEDWTLIESDASATLSVPKSPNGLANELSNP